MPGNSEKGRDVAGRGIEKTNMPIVPILSYGQSMSSHAKKQLEKNPAEGLQVTLACCPRRLPRMVRTAVSVKRMSKEKGQLVQKKFNSRRKKCCLLNTTLC